MELPLHIVNDLEKYQSYNEKGKRALEIREKLPNRAAHPMLAQALLDYSRSMYRKYYSEIIDHPYYFIGPNNH